MSAIKKTYSRANSLLENVALLSPLMNGPISAISYIVGSRGQPGAEANAKYKGANFKFRRCDLSAVKEILKSGEYEFLRHEIKDIKAPFLYDIGAHIGLFGLWALSVNKQSIVKSIEASPKTYAVTKENVMKAASLGMSWSVENRAAWKNNESVHFSDELESSMSHKVDSNGNVSVSGITFKDLIDSLPEGQNVDVMKIDIEGAEEAFLCAPEVDFSRVNSLVIELHPNYCDAKRVENLLRRSFPNIEEKHDSSLSKPLLYCKK